MHLPSELRFPDPRALVDNEALARTSPLTVAALRSIARFAAGKRFKKLHRVLSYFESTQYDDREFSWDGSYAAATDQVLGAAAYPGWVPPLSERKPPAIYGIAPMITERLTSLVFGEGRFPTIRCIDDPVTEDWFVGLKDAVNLIDVCKRLRDMGGAASEAYLSWSIDAGKPIAEVHDPRWVHVLAWRDRSEQIPAHVLRYQPVEEPYITREGFLEQRQTWVVREWMQPQVVGNAATLERVWRYQYEERNSAGEVTNPAQWLLTEEIELPVEYDRVPMVGVLNTERLTETWGKGDYEGSEGLIDELNTIMCATFTGTALNADPTLCIDAPPMGNTSPVRKGGFNTIFGRASYLELSGSSVAAGLTSTDKARTYALEATHVANLDPETIGGAQSGEALRRLMMPSTEHTDTLRTRYGNALKTLLREFARLARIVTGKPIVKDGQQVKLTVNLPPRAEKKVVDGQEKITKVVPRDTPGAGEHIELVWPPYFPDSSADQQAKMTAVTTAVGGKPVVSLRRAIEMLKPITGVVDIDQEQKDIVDGTREFAEAEAGPMGEMMPEPEPPASKKGSEK